MHLGAAREAVNHKACIGVISRDRPRRVDAERDGTSRARRIEGGKGGLMSTRGKAQAQRAEVRQRASIPFRKAPARNWATAVKASLKQWVVGYG